MGTKSLSDIRRRLHEKGVSRDLVSEAEAEAYRGDEESIIRGLLLKRGYDSESADQKEKAKTIRFLLGKGFSYDTFSDLL